MKKSLVLMAVVGVTLTGCVNDVADVTQKEQKKTIIGFDAPVMYENSESRATKTGEIEGNYPTSEKFQVFATKYSSTYTNWDTSGDGKVKFNDTSVAYDASLQGWTPKDGEDYYYWDQDMKLAFAACSPADLSVDDANRNYSETGLTISNFVVNSNPAQQYDLMFSERVYDADASKVDLNSSVYHGVNFLFQHALSSIHFKIENQTLAAKEDKDKVDIYLDGISISGVYDKGNFSENLISKDQENYKRDVLKGNSSPTWTNHQYANTTTNYQSFNPNTNNKLPFPETPIHVAEYVKELGLKNDANTDNDIDYGTSYPLLLIPQNFKENENAIATISYTVVSSDGTESSYNKPFKLNSFEVKEWLPGYRYTYHFVYSLASSKKDKIIFAPIVDGWINAEDIIIEIK